MNCPKCGHDCAPQFNFCPRCGALLVAAAPATPQATPLAVPAESMPATAGAVTFASPLVGRQEELSALLGCVDAVAGGRGGVVNLIGEGGIGKSRLVTELRLVKQPHPHQVQAGQDGEAKPTPLFWLEGGPLSLDETLPYWSWQGLLKNWLKSDEAESEAETQRKLRHEIERLLDIPSSQGTPSQGIVAHNSARVDQVYPYLATLLSLQLEDAFAERVVYLNAEGLKMQTFQAIRLWLERLAQTHPLVLVFEDLHRADATSLALLLDCMPLVIELPLLFINVFRPERECDCWQLRDAGEMTLAPLGRYTEIVLDRLLPRESDELIHNLLQRETLPPGLRAKVRSRAEGNPFFTEEIVRALIESNTLVRDPRHQTWTIAGPVDELHMPDTLQEVINTRVERLPELARQVLQRAAVVGRVFWGCVVAHLDADQDVGAHLNHLQRTGLIQWRDDVPTLGAEYTFRHALTHQAAYDSIPEARRREYHRRVAAFIEASFADRLEEYYGLLAHHAQQADDRERACRYAQEAAKRAAARYANQEAIRFYQQALELFRATDVKSRTQRFDLLQRLQTIYARAGQTLACERALREMLRLASLLADSDRLIEVYVAQAALYLGTNLRQAEESARLGLRLARVMEHHSGEARALLQRAWVNRRLWRKRQAIAQGEAALRASRRAGDRRIEGRVLCDLADFYAFNYDYETALSYSAQALEISQALGDRSTEAKAHLIASRNLSALGRHAEAIAKTQETISLARQISDRRREASSLNVLGITYANAGQYDPALDAYRESLEIYHQIDDRLFESWVYGNIGWMYVAQGHFESALDYFRNSHDASRRVDDRSVEARALMAMASLRRKLGQYDEVEHLANTARDIVPRAGWREIERWALGELSLAAWWRGDLSGALGLAQTALGHAYHQQDLQAIGWDMALLASVHLGQPWFGSTSGVGTLPLALRLADRAEEIGRQTRDRFIQIWGSEALSLVHWRLGQNDEALKWSQRTIELLERTPGYSDNREPLYLEHSLVLRACGHDDQAEAALQRARAELLRKADLMTDPDMRHTYLEQVPVSRAIQSAS